MRSNGLTLARTICHDAFGDAWHVEPFRDTTWGDALLAPSIIVCDAVLDVIGRYGEPPQASVTGMAHVTGGGITNAARMLPDDRGAYLPDLFDPHPVFTALQEYGDVADREAYRTWNMGQCFLIATPEPDAVTRILTENNLDVREAGVVTEEPGIVMESKGVDGGRIRYD